MATQVLSAPTITQSDPAALLQTGPLDYNFSDVMSNQGQKQTRILDMPRSHFNASAASSYRGTPAAPVATYAFKTTPQLRTDTRSVSSPATSSSASTGQPSTNGSSRSRYPANPSVSTVSSTSSDPSSISQHHLFNKEDALLFTNFSVPPFGADSNAHDIGDIQIADPDKYSQVSPSLAKPAPDRYRRTLSRIGSDGPTIRPQQSEDSIRTVGTATTGHIYQKPQMVSTNLQKPNSNEIVSANPGHPEPSYVNSDKQSPTSELPKRYRRRAEGNVPEAPVSKTNVASTIAPSNTITPVTQTSQTSQDARPSSPSGYRPPSSGSAARSLSNADTLRRVNNPSPLSRPATSQVENRPFSAASSTITQSPATAAMAALQEKDTKSVKSRLRRAFSFGSSAELRRAGTETQESAAERARARQQQFSSDLDDEQAAIARKQEKAGLGQQIYGQQTSRFTGSTDNLSISSTASSASIMLRKMGQGVKKGGRSFKGLFRPKSVIGVPSADFGASIGQVSMVNVEAEREQVNVNANPHDQPGGGTGFPHLERNSVEALGRTAAPPSRVDTPSAVASPGSDIPQSDELGNFRSASAPPLKKGILKRAYTTSPMGSPAFIPGDAAMYNRPPVIVGSHGRSASPAPSTGSAASSRHRRTDAPAADHGDYFDGPPRLGKNGSYRSLPGTPREALRRNISFSPRIQFHDVWSASDYDRRGDVATCNRLTPMLAQQIKEELNTFKMEMEVHELSKVHTHFF